MLPKLITVLLYLVLNASCQDTRFQRLGSRPRPIWGRRFFSASNIEGEEQSNRAGIFSRRASQFSGTNRFPLWNSPEKTQTPSSPKKYREIKGVGPEQQSMRIPEKTGWTLDNEHPLPIITLSKRKVDIYLESMSPRAYKFMHEQVNPVYRGKENELVPLTNHIKLHIYPGATAHCEKVNGTDPDDYLCTCPNGVEECKLNALMACVIHKIVDGDKYFNILLCLMGRPVAESDDCFNHFGLTSEPYIECARSSFGRWLLSTLALQGSRLKPAMKHEPWVVVSDVARPEAVFDLRKAICKTFDQTFIPSGCPPDWTFESQII